MVMLPFYYSLLSDAVALEYCDILALRYCGMMKSTIGQKVEMFENVN